MLRDRELQLIVYPHLKFFRKGLEHLQRADYLIVQLALSILAFVPLLLRQAGLVEIPLLAHGEQQREMSIFQDRPILDNHQLPESPAIACEFVLRWNVVGIHVKRP